MSRTMNRKRDGAIKVFIAYLKEQLSEFIMYLGFMLIFPIIFYFYNIRTDAVKYAFLLAFAWFLAWEAMRAVRFFRHHEKLCEVEKKTPSELFGMPKADSLIEGDYQRILEKVYREKVELESAGREFRCETADYYGMWVHQIKTPIAALRVLLQSYTLTKENGSLKDESSKTYAEHEFLELAREMKQELFKIEQYVEMVLVYLRTSDMTSDFVFEWHELDGIIRQAVKKYSQMFIRKKIKLNYEPAQKMVLTDEKWLTFVIEQLLSNAIKYTGQKTRAISIYTEGECLVIEDGGIGIWAEDLPRVFEKGFTGYNGREDKKSTGIGLYLCKTVTDKLKHGIRLESEVGKGTKAYIDFSDRTKDLQNLTDM